MCQYGCPDPKVHDAEDSSKQQQQSGLMTLAEAHSLIL